MSTFIFCSICSNRLRAENEHDFVITSCGKLYCGKVCLQKSTLTKCDRCTKCETILLYQAPESIQKFFKDLSSMFRELSKILDYQTNLRENLVNVTYKKYALIKSEWKKSQDNYVTLQKDHKRLQDEYKRLYAAYKKLEETKNNSNRPVNHNQTPFSNSNFSAKSTNTAASRSTIASRPLSPGQRIVQSAIRKASSFLPINSIQNLFGRPQYGNTIGILSQESTDSQMGNNNNYRTPLNYPASYVSSTTKYLSKFNVNGQQSRR